MQKRFSVTLCSSDSPGPVSEGVDRAYSGTVGGALGLAHDMGVSYARLDAWDGQLPARFPVDATSYVVIEIDQAPQ